MLSRQSGRLIRAVAASGARGCVSPARFYSAHHGEEHGHEEHGHDEHGHDDHSMPLSESESIFNSHTATAAGIVALIAGYAAINSSYKESHDGATLLSLLKAPAVLEELQANYSSYRERVQHQKEIQEMMMFPGERRTYDNLVTSIDAVPGRYFPSGSNTQFNTVADHDALAPRKTKESPFY
ncbi:hypothetical protein PICMEDRAFT_71204 [Pichia membranifaciens NRRL Y-2026]|uniref:Uncharacterized protein n=1 Tax=Pichia membranifaciens NRRL Y-2026 TaxID=763406 RepID=A0A1E3NNK7_9ASCO|nr:hypothetical protein PICMEDRAFT_71204 [Pichia membranifaciens NRRL Y-2026]ODQ47083.1 hypothetical protein PICMEDRAFT_71204 [Pichia membranifaciens NRRL Y-2026]